MDSTPFPYASPELEEFAVALTDLAADLDWAGAELTFAVERWPLGVAYLDILSTGVADLAAVDQLFAGNQRSVAGVLMRLGWSPDDSPTVPAWVLVAVRVGEPPLFAVRRVEEDRLWRRLLPNQAPWLVLSTSASLRDALEHGRPMVLKHARDERLFRSPGDGDPPPVDERGLL